MKNTILILLSCALLSAGFACSDDDELKVDPNALVNTQWAAHDTIPWMALGVYLSHTLQVLDNTILMLE